MLAGRPISSPFPACVSIARRLYASCWRHCCLLFDEAPTVFRQSSLPRLALEHGTIDYTGGDPAVLEIENRLDVRRAVAGETLVGPAERMRRQDNVVELEDRIGRVGRLLLEDIKPGAGNAVFLQRPSQLLLVDDRPACLIRYAVGFIKARRSALTR
jgi:hypothetical protein